MLDENLTIALLIDGENLEAKYIEIVNEELATLGRVTYKRLYGSLGNSKVDEWREISNEYSITISPQYTYTHGKNASDIDMAISAMDILYSGNVNAFCIMSNDSDFTGLAKRLKESNVRVIGAGLSNACQSFINVCDRFFKLDELLHQREAEQKKLVAKAKKEKPEEKSKKSEKPQKTDTAKTVTEQTPKTAVKTASKVTPKAEVLAFVKRLFETSGKTVLDSGEITKKIYQRYPDFDFKSYRGVKKSYDFFESEDFEVVRTENSNVNIKLKD